MMPAFRKNIPIIIKNTFNPDFNGTTIQKETEGESQQIKGISSIEKVSVLNISGSSLIGQSGFSGKLFSLLAKEGINVILITQSSSEHSITFAVEPNAAAMAKSLIEREFELEIQAQKIHPVFIEKELSIIAIVGENMKQTPGISGKLFHALGRNGINVRAIAQSSSEYNISVIIKFKNLAKALNVVHDEFFTDLKKTIHVFNIGVGGIGSTFLRQLKEQDEFLQTHNDLQIKVVGLSNSKKNAS